MNLHLNDADWTRIHQLNEVRARVWGYRASRIIRNTVYAHCGEHRCARAMGLRLPLRKGSLEVIIVESAQLATGNQTSIKKSGAGAGARAGAVARDGFARVN